MQNRVSLDRRKPPEPLPLKPIIIIHISKISNIKMTKWQQRIANSPVNGGKSVRCSRTGAGGTPGQEPERERDDDGSDGRRSPLDVHAGDEAIGASPETRGPLTHTAPPLRLL